MKRYVSIVEEIKLALSVGDKFLHGKFKNKTSTVASFDKDEKGNDIIITDTGKKVKLLNIRLMKQEKE
jgi:hypothetical protein